jgi:CO/xanthine dehydrogenase FAD-binding subunit
MATYLCPASLTDALAALAADAAHPPADRLDRLTPLAGATDFYPAATTRQAWFQPSPQNVLDLSGIAELKGISPSPQGIRIGALATWTDVLQAALPPAFDALKQASRQVGGVQIQNRGSIGGNLCNASPAADGVPPLLALDAEVELASITGTRRLPLAAFILGNRKTALRPGELLTAIHVPHTAPHESAAFLKLGARSYLVISIASVAANIVMDQHGRVAQARIAVGACSAVPQRLTQLEAQLKGASGANAAGLVIAEALAGLEPIDDVRATADYRRAAAITLVQRALDGLLRPQEQAA